MPALHILRLLVGAGAAFAAFPAVAQVPNIPIPSVNAQVHVNSAGNLVCASGVGQSGQNTSAVIVQNCVNNAAGAGQVGGSNSLIGIQSGSGSNSIHVIQNNP